MQSKKDSLPKVKTLTYHTQCTHIHATRTTHIHPREPMSKQLRRYDNHTYTHTYPRIHTYARKLTHTSAHTHTFINVNSHSFFYMHYLESKVISKVEWRRTMEQWLGGKKRWKMLYRGTDSAHIQTHIQANGASFTFISFQMEPIWRFDNHIHDTYTRTCTQCAICTQP